MFFPLSRPCVKRAEFYRAYANDHHDVCDCRWESTNLTISYNTSLELVEQLKAKLNQYVTEHNREWSGVIVNIDKMEYQNAIYIIIAMERMYHIFILPLRRSVHSHRI